MSYNNLLLRIQKFVQLSSSLFFIVILSACGSSNNESSQNQNGLLKRIDSASELETSLKAGLTQPSSIENTTTTSLNRTGGVLESFATPNVSDDSSTGFTTTYTQEANVDELDTVKYNGEYLFVVPTRTFAPCCFILPVEPNVLVADTGSIPPAPEDSRAIRILETNPDTAEVEETATIPLDRNTSVQGLYVDNEHLSAVTTESFYGNFGRRWMDFVAWTEQKTGVMIYNVSNASTPNLTWEAEIEGGFVDSRKVNDTIYIISRHTIGVNNIRYQPVSEEDLSANEDLLSDVNLETLLPKITVNGEEQSLVSPEDCYITRDAVDDGYPVITNITAINVNNPDDFKNICYNENAYGVYVSEEAIYLSQIDYQRNGEVNEANTRIHKFSINRNRIDYRGSAKVNGQLWIDGQSDFRISEDDNGLLRLMTSSYNWQNREDWVDHHLFILEESDTDQQLDIVSQLPNETRPQEIGKPNEQLYGVRFYSDRAYAVTFEQIDPLYVFDLNNEADPFIAGELEVTGFSDFLHPISEDLLLGLGRAENGGIKLELFNTADIESPTSLGNHVIGETGSYSEARYNRHAFTYQANVGDIDRFVIPVDVYETGTGRFSQWKESGVYLFEIHDKNTPDTASLNRAGSIIVESASEDVRWPTASRHRTFLHNDALFYVRDEAVWSSFWETPDNVNGPF